MIESAGSVEITTPAPPEAPPAPAEAPVEVKPVLQRKVAVVGEIPFSGKAFVAALVQQGLAARVLCPDQAAEDAVMRASPPADTAAAALEARTEAVPTVEVVRGDLDSAEAVASVLQGAYGVCFLSPVTLGGRMYRSATHLQDVQLLVRAAENSAIRRLVYHSTLGAHPQSMSLAMRQAAQAEEIIHACKCEDYRVRTGPLMGRGDGFLSQIVQAVTSPPPVMCVLGYGDTRLQPLHVNDLGRCISRIFRDQPDDLRPGYYCLAGPETCSEMELLDSAGERLGRSKLRIHIPLFVLRLITSWRKGNGFKERVNLLFDNFYTEQNDAPLLLSPGSQLISVRQAQEEVLAR
ncbi:MAG TPA: NmrA family NAD(P)-binding protein [Planctomycetota bacterium]